MSHAVDGELGEPSLTLTGTSHVGKALQNSLDVSLIAAGLSQRNTRGVELGLSLGLISVIAIPETNLVVHVSLLGRSSNPNQLCLSSAFYPKYQMQPFYLFRNGISTPQRIDRFPDQPRAVTTVNIHSMEWSGTVEILASLVDDPAEEDWFSLHVETIVGERHKRQNFMKNFTGRFVWMKTIATSASAAGGIDRITAI